METQTTQTTGQELYSYKGYHLVRNKREIYYGNLADDFITQINVMSVAEKKGAKNGTLEVADKLKIMLVPSSVLDGVPFNAAKAKTATRENLHEALEVAREWLSKAN
ncbi:MAG: hypothetical protein FWD35_06790 [Oscillospiraceae bacterium]|nr:hypothetical protein [Oscillospiraceae bacterium]